MVEEFESADEAGRTAQWPQIQKAMLDRQPVHQHHGSAVHPGLPVNVKNPYINALGANRLEDTWLA